MDVPTSCASTLLPFGFLSPIFVTLACLGCDPIAPCRSSTLFLEHFHAWKSVDVHRTWWMVRVLGTFPRVCRFVDPSKDQHRLFFSPLRTSNTDARGGIQTRSPASSPSLVLSFPLEKDLVSLSKGTDRKGRFPDQKRFSIHLFGSNGAKVLWT